MHVTFEEREKLDGWKVTGKGGEKRRKDTLLIFENVLAGPGDAEFGGRGCAWHAPPLGSMPSTTMKDLLDD